MKRAIQTIPRVLVLATLVLAGCSSAVTPEKAARIDPQKTGLVLATLIRTGPDDPKNVSIEFPFQPVGRPDNSFKNPGISSAKELWLVEVPPGRYQIAEWGLWCFDARTEVAEHPFEFEVRPGEVTYIGRLEVAVVVEKNRQGQRMYEWVQPVLEDHYGKAVAAFRKQYPALASVPVVNAAPVKLFAWNPSWRTPPSLTTTNVSSMDDARYKGDYPSPMPTKPDFLNR